MLFFRAGHSLPEAQELRASSLTVDPLHPSPGTLTSQLYDFGQAPQLLCNSISFSTKWDLFHRTIVRIEF